MPNAPLTVHRHEHPRVIVTLSGGTMKIVEQNGPTEPHVSWQNGFAERWVGSARRETLDHVIALNEGHLRRLLREYIAYHQEHREPAFSDGERCLECPARRFTSSILLERGRVIAQRPRMVET